MRLFLFTMAGEVLLRIDGCDVRMIPVGDTELLLIEAGTGFSIINPMAHELINYAICWFELTDPALPFHIELKGFDGREEMQYKLANAGSRVFIWVVQGAFEVKNRLLESRDAMVLGAGGY